MWKFPLQAENMYSRRLHSMNRIQRSCRPSVEHPSTHGASPTQWMSADHYSTQPPNPPAFEPYTIEHFLFRSITFLQHHVCRDRAATINLILKLRFIAVSKEGNELVTRPVFQWRSCAATWDKIIICLQGHRCIRARKPLCSIWSTR